MATLADSFLQDLEDLGDEEEEEEFDDAGKPEAKRFKVEGEDKSSNTSSIVAPLDDDNQEGIQDAVELYLRLQVEVIAVVSNLSTEKEFLETLAEVKRLTDIDLNEEANSLQSSDDAEMGVKNDDGEGKSQLMQKNVNNKPHYEKEYALIEKANILVSKIDIEILNIYSFIRDIYNKKFPELQSIVFSPLEYIAIVQRVQNETDLTIVDLSDLLPSTAVMAVTVASSMTTGLPLPSRELEKVLIAGKEAMNLADCRSQVLSYLESRMGVLAPNVSAIIGSALAARLVTHAGGLNCLARMPAQNIILVGPSKKVASGGLGFSSGSGVAKGVISGCDIVQSTPPAFRNRALKLVSGKLGLAARVDSFHESPGGEIGKVFRDKIVQALMKAQEPPPAPIKKSLPVPDDVPKGRRGGKRSRRFKEKYGMTEVRKQANRLTFGPNVDTKQFSAF